MQDFTSLPDLALRSNQASVVAASDESFEERENLINPWEPAFQEGVFGAKGQEYDGWETRRRRSPGHDWAVIRLGMPGVIRGIVIDTAWFKGNYPPEASVDACRVDGYPSVDELEKADWTEIVPRTPLSGDARHPVEVGDERVFTHVRLNIHPDGGVARLRVHGDVVPDPSLLIGLTVDLAALANGARTIDCSNMFYSAPDRMLAPGLARNQAEGWETARRRDDGNDWAVIRLAARGVAELVEIDTSNLLHNAPGSARIMGIDRSASPAAEFELLPRTDLLPDTPHRFRLSSARPATHVRLDIYPDGGIARFRLLGTVMPDAEESLWARWNAAKPWQARS